MAKSSPEQRSEWKNHISEQQKSKIPIAEYCRKNELQIHQFYYYRNLLFPAKKKTSTLIEVKPKQTEPGEFQRIVIYLNDVSVALEGNHDVDFLVDFCLKLDQQT